MEKQQHLVILGYGYTAEHIAAHSLALGYKVSIATRKTTQPFSKGGAYFFPFGAPLPAEATAVLSTIPPSGGGDPALAAYGNLFAQHSSAVWLGYLSSTGVYGDTGGATVTEESPLTGTSPRALARIAAEKQWLELPPPVYIFRLAGIYGPGRNMVEKLRNNETKALADLEYSQRPVNRIHTVDIAQAITTSITLHTKTPNTNSTIYNLADDCPAPTAEVMAYAANLLNMPWSPHEHTEKPTFSSHLMDGSRTVNNQRAKTLLHLKLKYPTYKEGLAAILSTLKG